MCTPVCYVMSEGSLSLPLETDFALGCLFEVLKPKHLPGTLSSYMVLFNALGRADVEMLLL